MYKKEVAYKILSEKDNLTKKEKTYKKIKKYFKKFKKDLEKLQKYRYNVTYGLKYLFNEISKEDYYEPIEIRSAFNDNYIEYESTGDKNILT